MSFITKRERVFNEYDLFDLPPRNEGKLKAYASCTDARAWSHFCSDKTEHLVEIIKRNNETCRTKYVPTDVIVETLMVAKNAEIGRLKHKIEEFEQMLAAYDQLDLTCDQKCEIANAHAAIKAANKELDDLCLDLDLSGFTEGIDSDAFETGKSRGDEPNRYKGDTDETNLSNKGSESAKSRGDEWNFGKESTPRMEAKSNQAELSCRCDASTSVNDPRIQEMQDTLISKDAKLSAMQNTLAVMENDICEPYCIYAHIYTALEKIFGVLCQNEKYKLYLSLMTAGKDTRCIDIKGKILYKLKVLEKFSLALIAPCSQEMKESYQDCACFRAEVVARLDFPSLSEDKPCLDSKRAQLVADIMENTEMKELLDKDSTSEKHEQEDEGYQFDTYSIDTENLKRLKNLQENYDDLMTCYEKLKYEKDNLQTRCHKYEELEKEFDNLKDQLREYNVLWSEKEHYRKRSLDIDSLKEQYLLLADETSNLETQLKAESEINRIKSGTIEELRSENITLEKKINEAFISFEKEKNALQCKLKETECTVMCQDQQIKSLSIQIDRLLEQNQIDQNEDPSQSLVLMDELEILKEQIKNLKDALCCSEEEKQQLQEEFQNNLETIHKLRMEIDDWKNTYGKLAQRNDYLEKYTDNIQNEMQSVMQENITLSHEVDEKTKAVENLTEILRNKSQEVKSLTERIEHKDDEKKILYDQVKELREIYDQDISAVEKEKMEALDTLLLARQESEELIARVKDYDEVLYQNAGMSKSLESKSKDYADLKNTLETAKEKNRSLQMDLISRETNNSILLQEIQKLREVNSYALSNITNLQEQKDEYKVSLDLTRKKSENLENKLLQYEDLSQELNTLKTAYNNMTNDKERLEEELNNEKKLLEEALKSLQMCKKESEELIGKLNESQIWQEELMHLSKLKSELENEKHALQQELTDKENYLQSILNSLDDKNNHLLNTSQKISALERELIDLRKINDKIMAEKIALQKDFDNKTADLNNLYTTLEAKIEENKTLIEKIKALERKQQISESDLIALQNENVITGNTLKAIEEESTALIDKLKYFETLEKEYEKLKQEQECIRNELSHRLTLFKQKERENSDLLVQNRNLQEINQVLEKSLVTARSQSISKPGDSSVTYEDVVEELNEMKKEKNHNHNRIKDLLNRLDESDNIISNLSEDILARNDKVAILENHINRLEDEIRRLHDNLDEVISTGENLKDNSDILLESSIKNMEAHHSKAAHNIRMELAKLHNTNTKLEEQLSVTQLKTEESSRDKNKYLSQLVHLQNEREIIVTDIKQLELKSVGDSALSPEKCRVEDVLTSLDRIRRNIEAKSSKITCLEQTILKVQTSSQLLLTKADEAKRLVEKEKQKIIMEKEDAVKDRLSMEKKVEELETKLDTQIRNDAKIIKDLEANILNQKLLNEHNTIKLKEELDILQSSIQNSTAVINTLQETIRELTEENEKYLKINENLKKDLESERKEKEKLQNELGDIRNKPVRNNGIQVRLPKQRKSSSQTDRLHVYEFANSLSTLDPEIEHVTSGDESFKNNETMSHSNIKQVKPTDSKPASNLLPKQNPHSINEVQILTANIEPSFDFVRSSYLNYKIQRLSPGRLEQYSISNVVVPEQISDVQNRNLKDDPNLVNIYQGSMLQTQTSSKINESEFNNVVEFDPQTTTTKPSAVTGFDVVIESLDSDPNSCNRDNDGLFTEPVSKQSTDVDLFVIYKDNKGVYKNDFDEKRPRMEKAETKAKSDPYQKQGNEEKHLKKNHEKEKTYFPENDYYLEEEEIDEDDSVKPKLKINLPRVEIDSRSIIATSDGDKKSLDSYTIGIYSLPEQNSFVDIKINRDLDLIRSTQETPSLPTISNEERGSYNLLRLNSTKDNINLSHRQEIVNRVENIPTQSDNKTKILRNKIPVNTNNENITSELNDTEINDSHHKLSRVGGDVYLIGSKGNLKGTDSGNPRNFGLDYILDSVQREIDPDNTKIYENVKELRKIQSDERVSIEKRKINDFISANRGLCEVGSLESKTISSLSNSLSKISDKSQLKSVANNTICKKIEDLNEYKSKIKKLTQALENTEKYYKKKMDAIKAQYDSHIKNILNEHDLGVKNIQGLHEETLQDIIKRHDSEIENLRSMSIEANRKAERLDKENRSLKSKILEYSSTSALDEEPTKIASEIKKRRRSRIDTKLLSKTNVEAFNVKPRIRSHGPCTCSVDTNISDTIRNIFEQVDVEQRKTAEHTYVKYIANKILSGNVETLDAQELSFLHLKVCRTWKMKLGKEEALQKRIDSLESELVNKQRHAQQHIVELDRKVAEERRRLQEVREAVCRSTHVASRNTSPQSDVRHAPLAPPPTAAEKDLVCLCNTRACSIEVGVGVGERRSAGDLVPSVPPVGLRQKRVRTDANRAVSAKIEEKREKKLYTDEPPTRLRRSHERSAPRNHKK